MDDRLTALPARDLIERLATREPVPGGGSAAALAGAMAAALMEMVVELTTGRPTAGEHEAELAEIGSAAAVLRARLLDLTELDAAAYDAVVRARRLPRDTDAAKRAREAAVTDASREATRLPLETAHRAAEVLGHGVRLAPIGNRKAVSDIGVGALLAGAALRGALLNVRINLPSLPEDDPVRAEAGAVLERLEAVATTREARIAAAVADRIG